MAKTPIISKMVKGSSQAGALRYDLQKDGAQLLETSCASSHWESISKEMDVVAASNSHCKNNCLHVSLSADQHLTDDQWRKAAAVYMKEMKLDGHQFALTRHQDTDHDHVHLTINRIGMDGRAWNDSKDFRRSHAACRVIEKELGLKPTPENALDGRFEQTKKDLADSIKAGRGRGLDGLKSEMQRRGYYVIENRQATGRLAGISIQSGHGKTWKASELTKGGWRAIERQLNQPQRQQPLERQHPSAASALTSKITKNLLHEATKPQQRRAREMEM